MEVNKWNGKKSQKSLTWRVFLVCLSVLLSITGVLLKKENKASALANVYLPEEILYWKNQTNDLQSWYSFATPTIATNVPELKNSPTFTLELDGATGVNNLCLGHLKNVGSNNEPGAAGNYTYYVVSFATSLKPNGFGAWYTQNVANWRTFVNYVHDVNVTTQTEAFNNVVIKGQVYGENKDAICFSGLNLAPKTYESGIGIIYHPVVTFYEDAEAMNTAYTQQILQLLQNGGITVNAKIDKTGLATDTAVNQVNTSINNLTQQQKEQFETEQQQREDDHNEAQGAQDEAKNVGTGEDETNQATENAANIFKTILDTPAGSCSIGPLDLYGFNMGSLNLCIYKPPEWIKTVMGAVVTITMAGASIKAISRLLDIVSSGLL